MMKKLLLPLIALLGFSNAYAQADDFKVADHKADPMTRAFDDNKHTVTGYIYGELEKRTTCCGNDQMYLEVEIDNTGRVVNARTLTGKNECFKLSVADIVKTIRWNATGVTGTKKIYFEVKPLIPCSGAPDENVYKPLDGGAAVASNTQPPKQNPPANNPPVATNNPPANNPPVATNNPPANNPPANNPPPKQETKPAEPPKQEVKSEPVAQNNPPKQETKPAEPPKQETKPAEPPKQEVKTQPVAQNNPPKKEKEDGFMSTGQDDWATMYDKPKQETKPVVTTKPAAEKTPVKPAAPKASTQKPVEPKVVIPPQEDIKYVSTGDHKPDESHNQTHKNFDPGGVEDAGLYGDESQNSVLVRKKLREAGVCGLATGLVELTLDPRGNVVSFEVKKSSNEKVASSLQTIVPILKFNPQPGLRYNYVTYFQFKTDILCEGEKRAPANLDAVPDYLVGGNN